MHIYGEHISSEWNMHSCGNDIDRAVSGNTGIQEERDFTVEKCAVFPNYEKLFENAEIFNFYSTPSGESRSSDRFQKRFRAISRSGIFPRVAFTPPRGHPIYTFIEETSRRPDCTRA